MDDDLVFTYDDRHSEERNFMRWFMMNCSEREAFKEQAYTQKEGLKVFNNYYNNRSSDGW